MRLPFARPRDDRGGVADEAAMIGLFLGVAVAIGIVIYAVAAGISVNLDIGV